MNRRFFGLQNLSEREAASMATGLLFSSAHPAGITEASLCPES
jgi:hypothetical protein